MTTVAQLAQKVRGALAVSSEYEGTTIPDGIRRVMRRLLRDYNFPKSIKRIYANGDTTLGQVAYPAPEGMKRPLEVRFFNPADNTYSRRLERREGFALPYTPEDENDAFGRYYWLEGMNIVVDTPASAAAAAANIRMLVWYQSMKLDAETEVWMMDDMEDLIFSSACMRLGAELRKTEAAQAFASLVGEEMQSIAIYANELEWNGVEVMMREPRGLPSPRYPAGPAA